ncbi:hypothetical protein [Romboutsia lituseburensis]|nr:hypothetical protein [Romboutsia lituseburensis]
MEILRFIVGELYIRFGNKKIIVALSQYLDKPIVKAQIEMRGN